MDDLSFVAADLDEPRHRIAVRELLDEYARHPMGAGRALPQDVLDRLVPGLQAHPCALAFLAFDSDVPAGVAVCFLGFSTFAARPVLNVHDLAVAAAYRRRGVARRLLKLVEARARELGCVKLTLEVLEQNEAARALYRSAGFSDADVGAGSRRTFFLERRLE